MLFATDPSLAIENSDFEQIKAGLAHADLHVMDDKLADNKMAFSGQLSNSTKPSIT